MPQVPDHEDRNIRQYVEGQLRDDEDGVTLVQRVGQERVAGTTYSMFDVHTIKGRWWVITDPTNLYDQAAFPEIDNLLSFHIGLGFRVMDKGRVEVEDDLREHAEGAWRRYAAAVEAMDTANDAEDFQSVGVKCREALLAIARENHDADWVGEVAEPPKGDNLKGWMEIFAAALLPDRRQRAYLKEITDKTWDIAVGLQHNTNATPWDAELTLEAVHHVLNTFMLARIKHDRGDPERCPRCGSYRLAGDGEMDEVDGEAGYAQWTICAACKWTSDREFESFKDWNERVGDRAAKYLAGELPEQQQPMPNDGFSAARSKPKEGA
ncbi:hypothetical protein [Quadrisphaera sp. INWT6]|uniref:hypothetical protein n=1 Tax=Quadrisphaera sp. INWT6 TaxID=2596917 RepID=UPI0018926E21|nr:hypothetical protein [Quadrisphaera sp. INWT6]MBF5082410.1 hypothetical protein [Quadrisphaera sp. INWT6]